MLDKSKILKDLKLQIRLVNNQIERTMEEDRQAKLQIQLATYQSVVHNIEAGVYDAM